MFAPEVTATSVWFSTPSRSAYSFAPATASAPDGSSTLRVSWNTSLIAAHSASVLTVTTPSRNARHSRKVSSPTSFTAVPSANRPTSLSSMRSPASSDCAIAHESSACTPMTLISGRTAFTYAATPDASPPPPIGTKIAWIGPWCWRRISIAMVPWPAITYGSSNGWTNVRSRSCCTLTACA
ncbi:hypothetical protein BSE24067_07209 [Burkholderia seminalis]|nr:hypothetical protein BSE24067_07209 [Burkholderia seminalis]